MAPRHLARQLTFDLTANYFCPRPHQDTLDEQTMRAFLRSLFLSYCGLAALLAEPKPGELFREYTFGTRFSEVDPATKRPNNQARRLTAMADRILDITTLGGATRAEVVVEYWGGHIGTSGQAFRINGNDWIDIPQPAGTPTQPQCYYRTLLRATAEVPLSQLKSGANRFQFKAGPQLCHGFDWGFYWVYAFTVRVYYKDSAHRPGGRIVSHGDNAEIGDFPRFVVAAESAYTPITRVDVIANYEDFNWEGDGVFRQWHYVMERGQISRHVGTAFSAPYAVTWNTQWVPDQKEPVEVAARITDNTGLTYLTPAVKLNFRRGGRSVRMFRTQDLPEALGVRAGRRATLRIPVDGPLTNARRARLLLSTWSAAHCQELGINGKKLVDRVGLIHNYSFDSIPVPMGWLKPNENVVHLFSNDKGHATEINWPGPVLLIEYDVPRAAPAAANWRSPRATHRLFVDIDPEGRHFSAGAPVEVDLDANRLHPVHVADAESGAAAPFQVDGRTLVFTLPHAVSESRRFEVYLSKTAGKQDNSAFKITDDVEWQGQKSFRIETPAATYIYHKEGAGFAALLDRNGKDWIAYNTQKGSAGTFRGIPNLGNAFGHPGYTGERGAESRILAQGPVRVRILSERRDKTWALSWDIYAGHARMTMLKNAAPYWFLYEGTPGGLLDQKEGYLVMSDGTRLRLSEQWAGNIAGPRWVYFAGPGLADMLFLANHQEDNEPDQYWPMQDNMTVFGFGRQFHCCRQFLNAAPARFSIGLIPASDTGTARRRIESVMHELKVNKSPVEARGSE